MPSTQLVIKEILLYGIFHNRAIYVVYIIPWLKRGSVVGRSPLSCYNYNFASSLVFFLEILRTVKKGINTFT